MKMYEIARQLKQDGYEVKYHSTDSRNEQIIVSVEDKGLNIDADAEYESVLEAIEELKNSDKRGERLSSWGGPRPGSGRPPVGTEKRKPRAIRLTDAEYENVMEFVKTLKL